MGSDMLYQAEDQARARSAFAVKLAGRLDFKLDYSRTGMPAEMMNNFYTGKVTFVDSKGVEHNMNIPSYDDAVKLYNLIMDIKKYLS